jgi:(2Fe-2S) ferredoxin
MRPANLVPAVHLFVCVNRREEGAPLGPGCGDAGVAVYEVMKGEVARSGAYRAVWITRTQCLGQCPKSGCTVAVYPRQRILTEVAEKDAAKVFGDALGEAQAQAQARR